LVSLSACDESPVATTVAITPSTVEMTSLGATELLRAEVLDQYEVPMPGVEVSWSSSDATIAEVSVSGQVTATGNGAAMITATADGLSGTASVTVKQSTASVKVSPSADSLAIGDSVRLVAVATDENGNVVEGADFTWSSNDESVATVDESGLVRGVGERSAMITAAVGGTSGSARVIVSHPDRIVLEAFYRSANGSAWRNQDNWLSDAPLGEWYGVQTERGGVTQLELAYNWIVGPIPPAFGSLTNLTVLDLNDNWLVSSIPPELGNLTNLTGLGLRGLGLLNIALTGPIPPELGNLTNLSWLDLGTNLLSGPIPSELGNVTSLTVLEVDENRLSGPLPKMLGNLTELTTLKLGSNRFSGPIPAEFARMSNLEVLELTLNEEMAGPLPSELTSLRNLDVLMAGGTELCVPGDPDFQTWITGIRKRRIAVCEGDLAMAYLTQAVQSRAFPVPLVAGEKALLRVFVTAEKDTNERMPPVRARFYVGGRETHVEEIPGKSTPIPTEVDEGDLTKSANAEIPAKVIEPGLEMVIEVDPEGTLDEELGVPNRIPETGRLPVDVQSMPVFDLTVIPFVWTSTYDSSIVDVVNDLAEDPDGHELLWETNTFLPLADLTVTAHDPVLSSSNDAFDLLGQTLAIRTMEGGTGYYKGTMSRPVSGAGGVAYTPGWTSFSQPYGHIFAHELGHNLSLRHAPCGGPMNADPAFPYPDGTVGAWGYDFRDGGELVQPSRPDLMSYCGPRWMSDYHFTNALGYRRTDAGSWDRRPSSLGPRTRSLLLWGGVGTDSVPFLEPAFVVEAPPTPARPGGGYQLTGRSGGDTELFSLSFAMPVVADGDGVSSFAFTIPAHPGWEHRLATITLSGPGGSVMLDAVSNRPVVILRNPRSGQVRAILHDVPELAVEQADVGAALGAGPGLEVLFSRGIPDAAAWRR